MNAESKYEQLAQSGKVEEALSLCNTDIDNFKKSKRYLPCANALHTKASMLKYYTSEYKKSLDVLAKEIEVRKAHQLPNIDAAYLKSAILYSYLNDKNKLHEFCALALEQTTNDSVKGIALNVIGDAIYDSEPQKAKKHFVQAEELFIQTKDEYNLSHVRLSKARLKGFTGSYRKALIICDEELKKGEQLNNPGIIGTANLRIAEVYHFSQNSEKASHYARKAHTIGINNNWTVLQSEANKFL